MKENIKNRDFNNYPELEEEYIKTLLNDPKLVYSIKLYIKIMNEFKNNSLALQDNIDFRSNFDCLYKLSESLKFQTSRNAFFVAFNLLKKDGENEYDKILNKISEEIKKSNKKFNTNDAPNQKVFASKVLHTIKNDLPIMDINVARCFGIRNRKNSSFEFKVIKDSLENYKSTDEAKLIIKLFNKKFKNQFKNCKIEDIKKIDFVLWIYGRKKQC